MALLIMAGSLRESMLAGLLASMELVAAQVQVLSAHACWSELRGFICLAAILTVLPMQLSSSSCHVQPPDSLCLTQVPLRSWCSSGPCGTATCPNS